MIVKDEFGFVYPPASGEMDVKTYYMLVFPSDDLGERIRKRSFKTVAKRFKKGETLYSIIGVCDSVIRERVMHALQYVMNCGYDTLYNLDRKNYFKGELL